MSFLPKHINKVGVPPIKCQGIKTKLIDFISSNIYWDGEGKWIEPFLGSGVVLFNIEPERALISDTNKHIIRLYQDIQNSVIDSQIIRDFLQQESPKLQNGGKEYYLEVRKRFNEKPNSLDFLFLNRSCFNGLMRFNQKGGFNVPFCHKPERFSKAYITKIVNQMDWVSNKMKDKDWVFKVSNWKETLNDVNEVDFVYLDPPYVGRNADYFNQWNNNEAIELADTIKNLTCGFGFSMWLENKYRRNTHIDEHWFSDNLIHRTTSHFYHVGSKESLRNEMEEILIIKRGYES